MQDIINSVIISRKDYSNMKEMMTAFCATSPNIIEKISLPIPEPDDYEVLVKNEGCAFCNTTDKLVVNKLYATPDYPVIFGHECFGKVIKLGKKVRKYKIGDRVICANAVVNGFNGKYYSSWGGFAEYGIAGDLEAYLEDYKEVDKTNSYRHRYAANYIIPSDFNYEKACLIFPLCEAASAVLQVGDISGKNVVVIGTGIAGYFFTYFAKTYGAANVVCLGRRESRLVPALKAGADKAFIDTDKASEFLASVGNADIVFECSGNWKVFEKGLPYLKNGGILGIYAVPEQPYAIDFKKMPKQYTNMLIGPRVGDSLDFVCEKLRNNEVPIDVFLTHKWDFDKVPEAFQQVMNGEVIKGLVYIS